MISILSTKKFLPMQMILLSGLMACMVRDINIPLRGGLSCSIRRV
jgi:hypothetical protein